MSAADDVPAIPSLTTGAAVAIANDEYYHCGGNLHRNIEDISATSFEHDEEDINRHMPDIFLVTEEVLDNSPRIVMQVVGLARLKYSINDDYAPSREDFQSGKSISYADDARYWGENCPYRLLLSDGEHVVPGKFYSESTKSTIKCNALLQENRKIHSEIHQLVISGQLKEGTVVSFVPNCHVYSGKGIVSIFRMKVEGWQEIKGASEPSHGEALAFSPIDIHQCTVPISAPMWNKRRPINSYVTFLVRTVQDFCKGHCVIAGSAALAEYLHNLPGCDHCYERHYSTFVRDICRAGDFNNDIDIFVPQCPDNLQQFYETGVRAAGISQDGGYFDEDTLEVILGKLYNQYGIRHTNVIRTSIQLSRLGEDSLNPYQPLNHDDKGTTQTTQDYGCE